MMKTIMRVLLWTGSMSGLLIGCSAPVALEDPTVSLLGQCEVDRESCRRDRDVDQIRLDKVSGELINRTRSHASASEELSRIKTELDKRKSDAEAAYQRVSELDQAKRVLVEQLQADIAKKDIEIELLKGRLTIRVLDRILFASGSAVIRHEGLDALAKIAEALAVANGKIRVEGHTDDVLISATLRDRYPTNWELSAARASSVVRLFQRTHQINPARLEAVGHSYYQAIAANDSPENRQSNRRVEVVLTSEEHANSKLSR